MKERLGRDEKALIYGLQVSRGLRERNIAFQPPYLARNVTPLRAGPRWASLSPTKS
jgi:hypothetical protein